MRKLIVLALCISLLGSGTFSAWAEEAVPAIEAPAIESIPTEATSTPVEAPVETVPEAMPETIARAAEPEPSGPVSDIELIVKLKDGADSEAVAAEEQATIAEEPLADDTLVFTTSTNESVEEAVDRLENNPAVEYAEPNYVRAIDTISSDDTYRGSLWALDNTGQSVNGTIGAIDADIDAPEAWQHSYGTSTIVAVIDSGVLYTHPEIAGNMWDGSTCVSETGTALGNCNHGYDFADDDATPLPAIPFVLQADHGTHVAGIIAASMNNATGTIGVAPQAKVMAIRFKFDVASEVKAIDFARENGVKIINASYGGTGFSQAEYDAIQRFRDAGGIFIAAAGNDGTDNDSVPLYPASYDLANIVSVAATDQSDSLADFSDYGITTVDLGAPGTNILSTITTDSTDFRYGYKSGTSMATPIVAGTAALARSLYPGASVAEIKEALMSAGDAVPSLSGKTVSGKRVNANATLIALGTDIDTEAPVITLTGNASISQQAGSTYTEQGATANDTHDGSVAVIIGGDTVNAASAGTYHVTYDATDTAGNHAVQVVRTVTITSVSSGGGGGGGGGGSSRKRSGGGGSSNPALNPARPLLTSPASTPAAVLAYSFTRPLSIGAQGVDVTALQQLLARFGFFSASATGYYGDVTASGVRVFQSARGLPSSGAVDAATLAALNQGQPATPPAPAVLGNSTSLQAQIASLLALVQELRARLLAQQGT